MRNTNLPLLSYLANSAKQGKNIPSIVQLSEELSLSTAAVREQLAVARQLEVVEVKTKTGIHTSSFSVAPAICLAFRYGLELDPSMRGEIASVRQHLELAFWNEAVSKLTEKDVEHLEGIVDTAYQKINNHPVILPLEEHKEFHLTIYRPLKNNYLNNLMEAYWELNSETDYHTYSDVNTLQNVWAYHRKIQQAIAAREFDLGFEALKTHYELVRTKNKATLINRFE